MKGGVIFVCPKCGYETEQPGLTAAEVTHSCPKAKPYMSHVLLKPK